MITVKKYLEMLSCSNETDLDKILSKMSEEDAKSFLSVIIRFMQKQSSSATDITDFFL